MFDEREAIRRVRGLTVKRLRICVTNGWVIAATGEKGLSFEEIDLARLQLICTLQDDIGVDSDLLPTMLALLDQVYSLRRDMRRIVKAVSAQPENIRQDIQSLLDS